MFRKAMRYLSLALLVFLLVGQHAAQAQLPVDSCCNPDEAASPVGCPTSCPLCSCCLDRTPAEPPLIAAPALNLVPGALLTPSTGSLSSPKPADILHVPKSFPV
jgi:hypothetical protein